ncbi:MAG TPA: hypothetical protein VM617_05645 [Thermoanaerobaculia bacterium]|nr:hypothetical protein [Thermoanaerobaculia bacterium]
MPDITITVTGTPPDGSYGSSSSKVQSDGTITVNPGTTSIQFARGSGQGWSFESPWITFDPSGPFTIDSQDGGQVTIEDNDPGGGQDRTFEYTLYTTQGNFDPEIINKGSG